jgi:hypothetical protein
VAGTREVWFDARWSEQLPEGTTFAVGDVIEVEGRGLVVVEVRPAPMPGRIATEVVLRTEGEARIADLRRLARDKG